MAASTEPKASPKGRVTRPTNFRAPHGGPAGAQRTPAGRSVGCSGEDVAHERRGAACNGRRRSADGGEEREALTWLIPRTKAGATPASATSGAPGLPGRDQRRGMGPRPPPTTGRALGPRVPPPRSQTRSGESGRWGGMRALLRAVGLPARDEHEDG